MTNRVYTVHCDGGARNNPGPAGAGFVIAHDGSEVLAAGTPLGETTNNVAEYCGFIWALENADAIDAKHLKVFADSSLLVNQLNGSFKVKDAKLKRLYERAKELKDRFESCTIEHVFREDNIRADELANAAMDANGTVGDFRVDSLNVQGYVEDLNATLFDVAEAEVSQEATPEPSIESFRGIYSLTVKGHFDAAHHLYNYPGECRDLHGHTWEVEVTVESSKLNDIEIVYDFKDLKEDLASVLDAYDHKLINDIAPFDKISPTAESLARVVYEKLEKRIDGTVNIAEVAVWESPIARVGYRIRR